MQIEKLLCSTHKNLDYFSHIHVKSKRTHTHTQNNTKNTNNIRKNFTTNYLQMPYYLSLFYCLFRQCSKFPIDFDNKYVTQFLHKWCEFVVFLYGWYNISQSLKFKIHIIWSNFIWVTRLKATVTWIWIEKCNFPK